MGSLSPFGVNDMIDSFDSNDITFHLNSLKLEKKHFDYKQENLITKNSYIYSMNDYIPLICNNINVSKEQFSYKSFLSRCFSLKIQCLAFIQKNYKKLKNKFSCLSKDLKYEINNKRFCKGIGKRRLKYKYIIWPCEKKMSKCYDHLFNEKDWLWIDYNLKYSKDHKERKTYHLINNNMEYDLILWSTNNSDKIDNWDDFIDFATFFDFSVERFMNNKYIKKPLNKSFEKIDKICKLINNNPYIDGKIKWYNKINRTYNMTELYCFLKIH